MELEFKTDLPSRDISFYYGNGDYVGTAVIRWNITIITNSFGINMHYASVRSVTIEVEDFNNSNNVFVIGNEGLNEEDYYKLYEVVEKDFTIKCEDSLLAISEIEVDFEKRIIEIL